VKVLFEDYRADVQEEEAAAVTKSGKAGKLPRYGARPIHLIITMIKWIRTRRLSIKSCQQVRQGRQTPQVHPQFKLPWREAG